MILLGTINCVQVKRNLKHISYTEILVRSSRIPGTVYCGSDRWNGRRIHMYCVPYNIMVWG